MTSIEWKNATPEQHNLWKYASGLIAYTTITPIYYLGLIGGSEFMTYNANKLYIALEVQFSSLSDGSPAPIIYDENNAISFYVMNLSLYWDVTAAALKAYIFSIKYENIYFGRVVHNGTQYIKFNGYRLNV